MMPDLWPDDLNLESLRTPVGLLKEQAVNLGRRTNNMVLAEVKDTSTEPKVFQYTFYLVAPALQNYYYDLLTISYQSDLYPVTFRMDEELLKAVRLQKGRFAPKSLLKAKDEGEYLGILKTIFSAERTKKIIQSLYAQSLALKESA